MPVAVSYASGNIVPGKPKAEPEVPELKDTLLLSSTTRGFSDMIPIRLDGCHRVNCPMKCLLKVFHWAKLQGNHRDKNTNAVWLKPLAGNVIVHVVLCAPQTLPTLFTVVSYLAVLRARAVLSDI